jgi:tetratricopeptide (TPR) repeat protein
MMFDGVTDGTMSVDRRAVIEGLKGELDRMRAASPAAVLKLSQDAGATTTRAAFLAMVKEFHPHRFARESREAQHLANEIFLLVKGAYDALCADAPPRPRRRQRGTTSPPAPTPRPIRAVRFKKIEPRESRSDPTPPVVSAPPRPSNHSQLVAALETVEEERATTFRQGLRLLKSGRPAEARELFRDLAVNKPGEKKYRVYMHYAWGREHQGAGRLDEATAELRRALKLDPRLDLAIEALDEIAAAGGEKSHRGRWQTPSLSVSISVPRTAASPCSKAASRR